MRDTSDYPAWQEHHFAADREGKSALDWQGLPVAKVLVPAYVTLADDKLEWSLFDPTNADVVPGEAEARGALNRFLRIEDGRGVLRFARRYGVLGICSHGLPAEHNPPPAHLQSAAPAYDSPTAKPPWCDHLQLSPDVSYDPIDRWLHFVRQARALLRISVALREAKAGSSTDWETVYEDLPAPARRAEAAAQSPEMTRSHLYRTIEDWLAMGNVRLRPGGYGAKGPPLLAGGLTFGVLAVQLLLAVTQGQEVMALCDGCGALYSREERAPKAGHPNYCTECRKTVAARIRKRRWRENPRNRESEREARKRERSNAQAKEDTGDTQAR